MIYNDDNRVDIPNVDLLTLLFDSEHCLATESTPIHANAYDPDATVITKNDARSMSQEFAFWIRKHYGIGKESTADVGDIVTVYSNGQAALPCVFYGVVAAGGVYSAASTLLDAQGLARQMMDGPCRLLVCSEDMRERALEAAKTCELPMNRVLVLSTHPRLCLKSANGSARREFTGTGSNMLKWWSSADPDHLRSKVACLVYSSGTTGAPKGVKISHANMVSEAFLPATINRPIWERWASSGEPFKTRTLAHLGAAHISGVQGYFVNAFFEGGTVYWMPRFDIMKFLGHIESLKITTMFSLPQIYSAMFLGPASAIANTSSLRVLYSGGMPLDPRVYDKVGILHSGNACTAFSETWGATETTGAATHMPPDCHDKPGSVGMLLPNMTMRIVDKDQKDVEPSEAGEAWLRGPMITSGYHTNKAQSREAFRDGWYRTGDIVKADGPFIYVLGRAQDAIQYNSFQIYPQELELLLLQLDSIADAAVFGVTIHEGATATCAPRALLVLKPGLDPDQALLDGIEGHITSKVPDYKRLRGGIHFISAVPREVSGKMKREKLPHLAYL